MPMDKAEKLRQKIADALDDIPIAEKFPRAEKALHDAEAAHDQLKAKHEKTIDALREEVHNDAVKVEALRTACRAAERSVQGLALLVRQGEIPENIAPASVRAHMEKENRQGRRQVLSDEKRKLKSKISDIEMDLRNLEGSVGMDSHATKRLVDDSRADERILQVIGTRSSNIDALKKQLRGVDKELVRLN